MGQELTDLYQCDICSGSPTLREVIVGAKSHKVSDLPVIRFHLQSLFSSPPHLLCTVYSPHRQHYLRYQRLIIEA